MSSAKWRPFCLSLDALWVRRGPSLHTSCQSPLPHSWRPSQKTSMTSQRLRPPRVPSLTRQTRDRTRAQGQAQGHWGWVRRPMEEQFGGWAETWGGGQRPRPRGQRDMGVGSQIYVCGFYARCYRCKVSRANTVHVSLTPENGGRDPEQPARTGFMGRKGDGGNGSNFGIQWSCSNLGEYGTGNRNFSINIEEAFGINRRVWWKIKG